MLKKTAKKETYNCYYTNKAIKIDGVLNEPVWHKPNKLNFFIPVTHKKPLSKTEASLCWDAKYLYAGFRAYDKDIWGYYKNRDDPTCTEDVLEIFFKTDLKKEPYYNFEINALGTVYDAFNIKKKAGGSDKHRWKHWNCRGLKVGVNIKGTLNNYEDLDEYWQLEVAIPFASLPSLKGKIPKNGDTWLFHLSRYDYSVYLPIGVELSSTAYLKEVNFHRYEDWNILKFKK